MKNSEIYLYGAGGHAKVIADSTEGLGWRIKGIFDNNPPAKFLDNKYPLYLELNSIELDVNIPFVVGIGNNSIRKRLVESELVRKIFATIIDRTAIVSKYAKIEEGTVIMPSAILNIDVNVGKHCIINTNASIDHDCIIKDFVHISPNVSLAGNVVVGEETHIGIGATVIQGIKIGKNCTIGAGAVIIRDVPDGATVVGIPGRIIKNNK